MNKSKKRVCCKKFKNNQAIQKFKFNLNLKFKFKFQKKLKN